MERIIVPEKIIQPSGIYVPERVDPLYWAHYPRVYTDWLRGIRGQVRGIDIHKVIVGTVMDRFLNDDGNIFVAFVQNPQLFTPASASLVKSQAETRLAWERSVPRLPRALRTELDWIGRKYRGVDWDDFEGLMEAKRVYEEARSKFELEAKERKNVGSFLDFYNQKKPFFEKPFAEFVQSAS